MMTDDLWQCQMCTFKNVFSRPGCEICGTERPPNYNLKAEGRPIEITKNTWQCPQCTFINERTRPGCSICAHERPFEAITEADKIVYLDAQPLLYPEKKFECGSCYTDIEPHNGVILRNCKCEVCKQCVCMGITVNLSANIECPICNTALCDRDIKNLISDEQWEHRLTLLLKKSRNAVDGSFPCLTPDCPGWTEVILVHDDGRADICPFFLCTRCHKVNCVKCVGQHDGRTCEAYIKELTEKKLKEKNVIDMKITEEHLQNLLIDKKVMRCPECKSVLEKINGCNNIQCGNPHCGARLKWVPGQG